MSPPVFDPSSRAFLTDPYPQYAEICAKAPVHWIDDRTLVVASYRDIKTLLSDRTLSVASIPQKITEIAAAVGDIDATRFIRFASKSLVFTDGAEHKRLKMAIRKDFTANVIAEHEAEISACCDQILDDLQTDGPVDIIKSVAHRLSQVFLGKMFGLTDAQATDVQMQTNKIRTLLQPRTASVVQLRGAIAALDRALGIFGEIADQGDTPAPFLRMYEAAKDADNGLSAEEAMMMCVMTYVAGHETSQALIGNALVCLARTMPETFVNGIDRETTRRVVTETLRFEPPLQITTRLATTPVTVGDKTLDTGQTALLLIAAGNRDPAIFENPAMFSPDRSQVPHLSFGIGQHACLGNQIAILEAEVMIKNLLDRFTISIAPDALARTWRPSSAFLRSAYALPATVVPR